MRLWAKVSKGKKAWMNSREDWLKLRDGNKKEVWGWSPHLKLVVFRPQVMSDSLWLHGLQHITLPCPSLSLRVCSNSCPLSQWCHPTISSSVIPFSSCLQSFPASGSFTVSRFFASGGQSIGASASASVLPMNIQSWFSLGLKPEGPRKMVMPLHDLGLWRILKENLKFKKL